MELRVLRYFLAVAWEESISGAAESLHLSQPTLSRQLMDLEEELGKQLFIRGNRKITLTADGILLRKRASEIVDLVEKTESEFRLSEDAIAGDIYIGGGESEAMRLIAKTAQDVQQQYPDIRYHLYSGNEQDVGERLDQGLLDFGVLMDPGDLKKYDYLKLPQADTWGVLLRKDSPLAKLPAIRPQDLWDQPLIVSRQNMGKDIVSNWLGRSSTSLNIVATYNLLFNASLLVDEGLGCALCLDKLANTSPTSTLCFRPLEPKLEISLYLAWKKFQVFSKAAEKYITALRKRIEAETPQP